MKCRICNTRKARRYCPGVSADICSICCGAEREVSISCPLDCPYLIESRQHDKPPPLDLTAVPNQDVKITEEFLHQNEGLLLFLGRAVLDAAFATSGAVDPDLREALDSLIRTYRTLQSGLYYETRPSNLVAAAVHQKIQEAIDALRKELAEKNATPIRDAELLGMLVFMQRIELHESNGRPRGRAFIDYLRSHFPENPAGAAETAPSLIQV